MQKKEEKLVDIKQNTLQNKEVRISFSIRENEEKSFLIQFAELRKYFHVEKFIYEKE